MLEPPVVRATVRTPLTVEEIRRRLPAIVAAPPPKDSGGRRGFSLHGGSVGDLEFRFCFLLHRTRIAPAYWVHGRIEDSGELRHLRLSMEPESSAFGGGAIVLMPLVVLAIGMARGAALESTLAATSAVYLGISYFLSVTYVPREIGNNVVHLLASGLEGSFLRRGAWVCTTGDG